MADDYAWLREKTSPEVTAFLEQENAYTRAVMKPTEELQAALYQEMLSHIKETDVSVPFRAGAYFYYSRTEQGAQYPIYCRKHGSLDASEEIMLDMNQLAIGESFMALGALTVRLVRKCFQRPSAQMRRRPSCISGPSRNTHTTNRRAVTPLG